MSLGSLKSRVLPWVVCLSASLFFAYELLQLHVMNAISPMLIRELNLSATEFGYLSSTYLLADVIFLLPAGIILDRFSVRRVILAALFLCLLGTAGFAKSTTLTGAALCHFLSGIGNAFCFLSCIMLISRWFPKERQAFVVGLMITIGMLGGVVAQLPFSLLAEKLTWRAALMIDAAVGVALFALIFAFVKDAPKPIEKVTAPRLPFWEGFRRAVFNIHNVSCGFYTCMMNLPLMIISALWGTLFLTQAHQIPIARASLIISMICMGTIVGAPLFGWLSDKMERRRSFMAFGGISSILLFMAILWMERPSEGMFAFLFFLLGLLTSSQALGYPAITEHSPKELTGTSMGVAALIIMGLPALIQPLSGTLLDMGWDKTMANGAPLYSAANFKTAFMIFPIGFAAALLALTKVKGRKAKAALLAT